MDPGMVYHVASSGLQFRNTAGGPEPTPALGFEASRGSRLEIRIVQVRVHLPPIYQCSQLASKREFSTAQHRNGLEAPLPASGRNDSGHSDRDGAFHDFRSGIPFLYREERVRSLSTRSARIADPWDGPVAFQQRDDRGSRTQSAQGHQHSIQSLVVDHGPAGNWIPDLHWF